MANFTAFLWQYLVPDSLFATCDGFYYVKEVYLLFILPLLSPSQSPKFPQCFVCQTISLSKFKSLLKRWLLCRFPIMIPPRYPYWFETALSSVVARVADDTISEPNTSVFRTVSKKSFRKKKNQTLFFPFACLFSLSFFFLCFPPCLCKIKKAHFKSKVNEQIRF